MLWALLALLLAGSAQSPFGPDVPDARIVYLGGIARPAGTEGLHPVAPAAANAILFSGGFGFGAAAMFRAALDAAPQARLVAFDSPGGRPFVAQEIAGLIRVRCLDTSVERFCASACIVAFVAGTVRTAGPRAKFAFHRAFAPALEDLVNMAFLGLERAEFVRSGVSLTFAERALHAPNAQPYVPPLSELVAAGFLHRIRGLRDRRTVVTPGELWAAMRQIEPQTAAILTLTERQHVPADTPNPFTQATALNEASLVVSRWLSRSSDTAIRALLDARIAALSALDATSCVQWQAGLSGQDAAYLAIPEALRQDLERAETAILQDANAYPQPLPDRAYAAEDGEVRSAIAAHYGRGALTIAASPEHAFDDPAKSCAVSIAYLRALREREEGAALLRWALAAG